MAVSQLRTYVVNLPRRADRRLRLSSVLPPKLPVIFTSQWPGPFDGRQLNVDLLHAGGYRLFPWRIPSDNAWWNRELRLGEIGCALSHLACWQDAANSNEPFILVLEDDIVLANDFLDVLCSQLTQLADSGPAFDLLYLGRCSRGADRPARPNLVYPGFSYSSIGYLLSRQGLETLLAARFDQAILPVDEFLPALYCDHPRADVRARYPRQLTALAFDPPLVWILPADQVDSDTRG
jgi:glycosyl transferase, family 25